MKNRAGAITVAGNIWGPLDLARTDPTVEDKSTISYRGGAMG